MIAGLAGRTEQGERLVESLAEPGPSAPKGGVSPASFKEPGLAFPPGTGSLFFRSQISNAVSTPTSNPKCFWPSHNFWSQDQPLWLSNILFSLIFGYQEVWSLSQDFESLYWKRKKKEREIICRNYVERKRDKKGFYVSVWSLNLV